MNIPEIIKDRRESDRKLTEALLEVVERRDRSELGELQRRLYIAERDDCLAIAAIWRKQIQKLREEQRP